MLHHIVLGAVLTGLNGISLWHSVPFTGLSPSNGILWRSFSSLEIAGSFYGLRYVYPFVFPDDDATLKEDVLLQHSIHSQKFENARLALQQSSKAVSYYTNTPMDIKATKDPITTENSSSTHLPDSMSWIRPEELTQQPGKSQCFFWNLLILGLVGMHIYELRILHTMNSQPPTATIQRELDEVTEEIGWFRQEFGQVIPNLHGMGTSFTDAVVENERLYRETMEAVDLMGLKFSESMSSIDSQLSELRKKTQGAFESVSDIPKQLAWLNTLVQQTQREEDEKKRQLSGFFMEATSPSLEKRFSSSSESLYSSGQLPIPSSFPDPPKIRGVPPRDNSKSSSSTLSNSGSISPKSQVPSSNTQSTPSAPPATLSQPKLNWNTRPAPPP
jgi:hypothetical protein